MTRIVSIYAINALAFAANIAAIFLVRHYAGSSGYGVYGIYLVFTSVFLLLDTSLIKAAILRVGDEPDGSPEKIDRFLVSMLPLLLPFFVVAAFGADFLYPIDPVTGVGGSFVAMLLVIEFVLSYPVNALVYQWTVQGLYSRVFILRLSGTLLKLWLVWLLLAQGFSIQTALIAVIGKGLVFFVLAHVVARRAIILRMPVLSRDASETALIVYQIFGSVLMLLVMQEAYSVHVDRTYGREALGDYRTVYDIVNGIWFLATIYPTILFPYLKKMSDRRFEDSSRLHGMAVALALLHVGYGLTIISLISLDPFNASVVANTSPYSAGLVIGVAVMGYNRFLIEVVHALGAAQLALWAVVAGTLSSLFVLASAQSNVPMSEIGKAWATSQLLFMAGLMAIIFVRSSRRVHFSSAGLAILVFAAMAGTVNWALQGPKLAAAGLAAAFVAGLLLLATVRRLVRR